MQGACFQHTYLPKHVPHTPLPPIPPPQIIRIPHLAILKRPIEPTPIISRKRPPQPQPLHQIRIADEVAPKQQGVVAAGLDHAPTNRVVPAASGKEGRRAEDAPEQAQVRGREAPGFQVFFFFGRGDELLVALDVDAVRP